MKIISGLLLALLVSGCQSANGDFESQRQLALDSLLQAQQQTLTRADDLVTYSDDFYIPPLAAEVEAQPKWYSRPVEVAVDGMTARALLAQTLGAQQVVAQFLEPELAQQELSLAYSGSLGGLLRLITAETGWHADISRDQVSLSRYRIAEFDVAFLAGNTNFFMGNSDSQGGGNATAAQSGGGQQMQQMSLGSGSEQYLNFSSKELSVWDDLERALGMLLSPTGQLSVNQSSTSVLVRDFPHHVAQVEAYLEQQNERLMRQVSIEVQIIDVTFNDEQQFAIDWQALLRTAGGEGVLGLDSASVSAIGGTAGTRLVWEQQAGSAKGSRLFLEALEQQGLVQMSSHPRLISLNNQIAKIVLEDNATYLAAAGTTSTPNVGTTETLQPGVVTTGFELYVLPSIRAGEVILQLSTELSDLERIDEIRSGDQLIQTPHTNRKKFFMKALIEDGQTLLLTGLRNERNQHLEQKSWLSMVLGGGQGHQQRRSETLLLLTPRIVNQGTRL
ncbi:hypothetical protein [Pseudidiomarina sp.]|uniref:hypothetical protein n=1 Tax=Pseudidiomarina sp. TaxID=2081707 RepID=UPI00299D6ED0|nr:hypothetical protein [Pseudidiomarina sp.]MDX1705870.1 hypothetical protein [Pseudidiomarina sp.]